MAISHHLLYNIIQWYPLHCIGQLLWYSWTMLDLFFVNFLWMHCSSLTPPAGGCWRSPLHADGRPRRALSAPIHLNQAKYLGGASRFIGLVCIYWLEDAWSIIVKLQVIWKLGLGLLLPQSGWHPSRRRPLASASVLCAWTGRHSAVEPGHSPGTWCCQKAVETRQKLAFHYGDLWWFKNKHPGAMVA